MNLQTADDDAIALDLHRVSPSKAHIATCDHPVSAIIDCSYSQCNHVLLSEGTFDRDVAARPSSGSETVPWGVRGVHVARDPERMAPLRRRVER